MKTPWLRGCIPSVCVFVLALRVAGAAEGGDAGAWIPLFNGKNLTGWTPKFKGYELGVNHANTFRVEDGVLRVVYDDYSQFGGAFGHLFYQTPYSNYVLRVEYRFVGEQTPGGPGLGVAQQRGDAALPGAGDHGP